MLTIPHLRAWDDYDSGVNTISNPTIAMPEDAVITTQTSPELLKPKPIPLILRAPEGMRLWTMYRHQDESGVSGSGIVAQGCMFANGQIAVQWIASAETDVQTKRSMQAFLDVHVHSHPANGTIITWDDGKQDFYPADWRPQKLPCI